MQSKAILTAIVAEQESCVQNIRRNLVGARDSIRAATEAIERLSAQLGKRG